MRDVILTLAAVALGVSILGCKSDRETDGRRQGAAGPPTKPAPPPKTIHEAARRGDAEAIARFLAQGVSIQATDDGGFSPLHCAAEEGQPAVARLLLSKGADVDAGDKDGFTPLVYAAMGGHTAVAEVMIDAGAKLHPRKDLTPPLDLAKKYKHKEMVDLLRCRGAPCRPSDTLYDAIENWDTKAVAKFLAEGAPVDEPDAYDADDLPLHHVAQCGFVDIAELLLAKGADVNARRAPNQDTPLHDAVFWRQLAMAEFLLSKGADPNAKDRWGDTPMYWPLKNRNAAMIKLLKRYGGKEP